MEVFRLFEMINDLINSDKYDVVLITEDNDWLQVFKEKGKISIAKKEKGIVCQIFALSESISVHSIIKNYYIDQSIPIPQNWDNQENINTKNIVIDKIFLVIFLVLLLYIYICIKIINNNLLIKIGLFLESNLLLLFGINGVKMNQYIAKPYIMIIFSIVLFVFCCSNLFNNFF